MKTKESARKKEKERDESSNENKKSLIQKFSMVIVYSEND